jgi:1-acyl-sn-glycerol-3-phosphate acyltransferase
MPRAVPLISIPGAPLRYRFLRRLFYVLLRLLTHIDVEGLERVPRSGPLIMAPNHLHIMDAVVTFTLTPRRITVFAADKWRGTPFGWIMSVFADAIYVARGEPDRKALGRALAVLQAGGTLGVAPEGTRSRTGGLQHAHSGVAYLATRTGASVLPVAVWGQEDAFRALFRLRRADIHVSYVEPIVFPEAAARARTGELEMYTDEIMLTIARQLPAKYRGVYSDRV